ncbi:hypothetical protein GGS26DRAFT_388250 [Hypomontagnella submonticulosa]|nr:hypothetical protein GGS26DRAFT_388250 [Hypomontagnella submonticulosa]
MPYFLFTFLRCGTVVGRSSHDGRSKQLNSFLDTPGIDLGFIFNLFVFVCLFVRSCDGMRSKSKSNARIYFPDDRQTDRLKEKRKGKERKGKERKGKERKESEAREAKADRQADVFRHYGLRNYWCGKGERIDGPSTGLIRYMYSWGLTYQVGTYYCSIP